MKIFILHRGWVVAGTNGKTDMGPGWVGIDNAYVVRRWGTSKGLGELAEVGPLNSTVLDKSPHMDIPTTAIINTIECDAKAWKKWLHK